MSATHLIVKIIIIQVFNLGSLGNYEAQGKKGLANYTTLYHNRT